MDDENERTTEGGVPDGSAGSPTSVGREGAETSSGVGSEEPADGPTGVGSEDSTWSSPSAGEGSDRAVGDGATTAEEATLKRVRTVSRLLDDAVRVPGTDFRVGIDPILGILPVAGDGVAMLLSLYPVLEAYRLGMSRTALAKMLSLVAVDAVVGSVPLLGPVFDAFWKANKWNLRTLERHLGED